MAGCGMIGNAAGFGVMLIAVPSVADTRDVQELEGVHDDEPESMCLVEPAVAGTKLGWRQGALVDDEEARRRCARTTRKTTVDHPEPTAPVER